MNPADGFLPLVGRWLLEYACRHRMLQVLQGLPIQDGQVCGPAGVRLSLCVLEIVAKKLDTCTISDLEMAIGINDRLYEIAGNFIPFKLYFKVSSGLKALLLFNMLENSEEKVFEKCEELMPRDGIIYPKASGKEKITYSGVIRRFRKMFLPLVANNKAWRTFRCTRLPDIYGAAFRTKLKDFIVKFVTELEEHLPITVLEQILKGRLPEIAQVRSVSMTLLIDHIYNKSVLTEEEVLDLMSGLLPGSVERQTQNLGNVLDSQPSYEQCSLAEMGEENVMLVDTSPEIISSDKDNSRGQSTSSEEIVEGTPDEQGNKRFSFFSQRTTGGKETTCSSPDSHLSNRATSSSSKNNASGVAYEPTHSPNPVEEQESTLSPNVNKRRLSNHQEAFLNFLHDKGISVSPSPEHTHQPPSTTAVNRGQHFTVVTPLSYRHDSFVDKDSDEARIIPAIDWDQFAGQDDTVSSSCPDSAMTDSNQIFSGSQDSSFHTCDSRADVSEDSDNSSEEDISSEQFQDEDVGMQVISPIKSVTPCTEAASHTEDDCSFSPTNTPPPMKTGQAGVPRNVPNDSSVADSSYNSMDELESGGFEVNSDSSPDKNLSPILPSSYSFEKYDAVCGNPARLLRMSLPRLTKHLKPCSVRACIVKLFKQDLPHDGCPIYS